MIDNLICILTLVAVLQPDKERRTVAGVFCCATLLHHVYMSELDGFLYYGSAAVFDLAIISILSKMHTISNIVLKLQRICVVSILVNLIGWGCWYHYLPPDIYNLAFLFIYLWVIAALLQGTRRFDLGNTKMDSLRSVIRSIACSGNSDSPEYKRTL